MMDDPEIIRLNIRHYEALLKLHSTTDTRQQVIKLLAEARTQLPLAMAEAAESKR
jgi:hypothetical protein